MKSARTNSFELPEGFLDGFTHLPNDQKRLLLEALDQTAPTSVRANPYKRPTSEENSHLSQREAVPWSSMGSYLSERPIFTTDPLHHAGAYYVQEAGSMFIEQLFLQSTQERQPQHILDLCASPGGKTTLLASLAPKDSLVVANEVIRQRVTVLADNVRRWGTGNIAVTSADPSRFSSLEEFFDLILVDAPCSGEGMFRKDHKARAEWSPEAVKSCVQRQRRILADIWQALAVGGTLIYSTCTFNNQENEENVQWLCDNFDCQPVNINTEEDWGVMRGEVCGIQTFRFLPHRTRSEGFFAAVLRKGSASTPSKSSPQPTNNKAPRVHRKEERKSPFSPLSATEKKTLQEWLQEPSQFRFNKIGDSCFATPAHHQAAIELLVQSVGVVYSGVAMGRFFRDEFKPDHALALYSGLSKEAFSTIELNEQEALEYLRKHELSSERLKEGINLVCYKGLGLGWTKRSGSRTTNMLPKELRIINF